MDWLVKLERYLLLVTFCPRQKATANIIYEQITYVLQKQFLQTLQLQSCFLEIEVSVLHLCTWFLLLGKSVLAQEYGAAKIFNLEKCDACCLLSLSVVLCQVGQTVYMFILIYSLTRQVDCYFQLLMARFRQLSEVVDVSLQVSLTECACCTACTQVCY